MHILVILAHPTPGSFNHAIAQTAVAELKQNGHPVVFHDLVAEGFDPILPGAEIPKGAAVSPAVEQHCRDITNADGIVIVHPNWWGQPPSILKGWVDRVIRPGVAYEFVEEDKGEGVPVGLLKAKAACVFNTSNTEAGRETKVFGDPLETIWKNCVFGLCGLDNFYRKNFAVIVTSTPGQRREWLEEARDITSKYFPKTA